MSIHKKLGYPENTKLLIVHADDAGLCQSENLATIDGLKNGIVNSYSIMAPCPGFREIAEFALNNPQYDYGIHLTLTCEWKNFKWGPISPIKMVSNLVDKDNHFHSSKKSFVDNVWNLAEIKIELKAQIDQAIAYGLKPSHLDCHMYSLGFKLELFHLYKQLGREYKLPVFISDQLIASFGFDAEEFIDDNDLCIPNMILGNYEAFNSGRLEEYYIEKLNNVRDGLNILLLHCAYDNEEMKDICVDHPNFGSEWRQIDLDFINSDVCKELIKSNNIELITWNQIKEVCDY